MIGSNIRNIRKKKKITQKDLAETMGVSRQAICMWETGKRELKVTTLHRLAEAFSMPVQYIINPSTGSGFYPERPSTKAQGCPEFIEGRSRGIKGGEDMVKKGEKKIKFELLDERAARVALTGDFNSWDKSGISLRKDKNGMWQKEISLRPGKYQYKFIVDGQWRTDPLNKVTSHNPFGGENSVKEVI